MLSSRPGAAGVRAVGNLALTACALLFVLVALSPRAWGATGVLVLAVVGVGARIEAAVLDAARRDGPAEP